jgi:hypothetical protein
LHYKNCGMSKFGIFETSYKLVSTNDNHIFGPLKTKSETSLRLIWDLFFSLSGKPFLHFSSTLRLPKAVFFTNYLGGQTKTSFSPKKPRRVVWAWCLFRNLEGMVFFWGEFSLLHTLTTLKKSISILFQMDSWSKRPRDWGTLRMV